MVTQFHTWKKGLTIWDAKPHLKIIWDAKPHLYRKIAKIFHFSRGRAKNERFFCLDLYWIHLISSKELKFMKIWRFSIFVKKNEKSVFFCSWKSCPSLEKFLVTPMLYVIFKILPPYLFVNSKAGSFVY